MPLLINLRHLEKKNLDLKGELSESELELEHLDEMVRLPKGVKYDLEIQKLEHNLLAQGKLSLTLECECVRCLKPFKQKVVLDSWAAYLPLEGEEKATVVNDCVDLTPYIREDIVLSFPQHPLCDVDCGGLPKGVEAKLKKVRGTGKFEKTSAWAELDKLKLK